MPDPASKMYFHAGLGDDVLWFQAWQPTSVWATAAIWLVVCALAVFERWMMSLRRTCESRWGPESDWDGFDRRSSGPHANGHDHLALRRVSSSVSAYSPLTSQDISKFPTGTTTREEEEWAPSSPQLTIGNSRDPDLAPCRFRWRVDLARGGLQAAQTTLHYLLMLVVMTFNIWWTVSVILGSGIGEVLFGRLAAGHQGGSH